jgi:hypothetical protein
MSTEYQLPSVAKIVSVDYLIFEPLNPDFNDQFTRACSFCTQPNRTPSYGWSPDRIVQLFVCQKTWWRLLIEN